MRYLLAFLLSLFALTACGDSNLFNSAADENSNHASRDALEFALNNRDYGFVISKLENKNYNDLTLREKYLLQSAWLGASGFSLLGNIGELFEDDITFTDIIMSTQTDGSAITLQSIKDKRGYYSKVVDMCNVSKNGAKDGDIDFIGGVASMLDSIMVISQISVSWGGSSVSFDKNSPNYIGNIFNNKSEAEIRGSITAELVSDLNNNMDQLDDTVSVLSGGKSKDVRDKMDEFKADITNNSGVVTIDSLYAYIEKYFSNKGA